jgi:hypothetical protein
MMAHMQLQLRALALPVLLAQVAVAQFGTFCSLQPRGCYKDCWNPETKAFTTPPTPTTLRTLPFGVPGCCQVADRSHCRFVLPRIHFIPDSLAYSVPLCMTRQCGQTLLGQVGQDPPGGCTGPCGSKLCTNAKTAGLASMCPAAVAMGGGVGQ